MSLVPDGQKYVLNHAMFIFSTAEYPRLPNQHGYGREGGQQCHAKMCSIRLTPAGHHVAPGG